MNTRSTAPVQAIPTSTTATRAHHGTEGVVAPARAAGKNPKIPAMTPKRNCCQIGRSKNVSYSTGAAQWIASCTSVTSA